MPDQFRHPVHWLQRKETELEHCRRAIRCVARLIVRGHEAGSGFLLRGDWLLTCQHVLPSAEHAAESSSTAEFGHSLGADGRPTHTTAFHLDPASYRSSPRNGGEDWALVRLLPHPQCGHASVLYHGLRLEDLQAVPNSEIVVIQHPLGGFQKLARSRLIDVSDRLRHDVATAAGSSGSPVFDSEWRVIGLHQGVIEDDIKQAIPIGRVIAGIRAAGCWPLEPLGLEPVDERVAMEPDSPWYIEREADRRILTKHHQQAVTLYLKGPPQLGKSSVVRRLEKHLADSNWTCVSLDLRSDFAEEDFESAPRFFRRFAEEVMEVLHDPASSMEVFKRDRTAGVFSAFLGALGRGPDRPLALTLDRLEELDGKPCCAAVLSGLLKAHEARGRKTWLRMILVSTLTPQRSGVEGSVLEVAAARINIADFTLAQLTRLIALHGSLQVDAEQLHEFLGGHPALSRHALNHLAEAVERLEHLFDEARRDGGIFRPHLNGLVERFRELGTQGVALANEFRALVRGHTLSSELVFETLLALGVVSGTDRASARPRSKLYCDWLPGHLPPR